MPSAIATNHQSGPTRADRPAFTRSFERHAHLKQLRVKPRKLNRQFLKTPLVQDRYAEGFGTLFTAEYNPLTRTLGLTLIGERWDHSLEDFEEGQRNVDYSKAALPGNTSAAAFSHTDDVDWSAASQIDWSAVVADYASGQGRDIHTYLPRNKACFKI